jgi:ion channel-forming bestrophin family protein
MSLSHQGWFKTALSIRGSVIPVTYRRVLFCGLFSLVISVLYYYQIPVSQKVLSNVVPSIVLGLLLVFRTNTAYDRFWEGRKGWGMITTNSRNLARLIWVAVETPDSEQLRKKAEVMDLLSGFAIATKCHLRGNNDAEIMDELAPLIPSERMTQLIAANHRPLEIVLWLSDYLDDRHAELYLKMPVFELHKLVNNLVEALGVCERILKTPMPLAYGIHLRQLLLIYCLLLPFQIVAELSWWTAPIVMLISFTLLGIEAIGVEIENPFGQDPNDLPLDSICQNIRNCIEDLKQNKL